MGGRAEVSLVFNPADHSYTWNGNPVPGVTSIINPFIGTDFSFVDPALLEAASILGRRVHAMIERDIKEGLELDQVDFDLIEYFLAWRDFRDRSGFRPLLSECYVYSQKHGYAGQLDLFGEMDGELILPDIKRVASVSRAAAVQTAAYLQALKETHPELVGKGEIKRCALHLKKGGGWALVPFNDSSDFKVFLGCKIIHDFKRKAL